MSALTLRQEGTWLPADVQTPISLFLGLVGERPGILLESAEVDGRLGRYSLIAWDFRLRLRLKDGRLDVSARDPRLAALALRAGISAPSLLRPAGDSALTEGLITRMGAVAQPDMPMESARMLDVESARALLDAIGEGADA